MQKGPRPLAASSSFSSSSCFLNMFLVPSSLTRSPCCQQESADYKLVQTIMFHVAATLQYPKKARGKVEMCCSIRRSSEVDKPLPEIKSGELSNFFWVFHGFTFFFACNKLFLLVNWGWRTWCPDWRNVSLRPKFVAWRKIPRLDALKEWRILWSFLPHPLWDYRFPRKHIQKDGFQIIKEWTLWILQKR